MRFMTGKGRPAPKLANIIKYAPIASSLSLIDTSCGCSMSINLFIMIKLLPEQSTTCDRPG